MKGKNNSFAHALSRLHLTSEQLKEMNQTVMNVMTRGQRDQAGQQRDDIISNNDWPDQPKVVEIHSKPKYFTELRFISIS